ncbi:MAG TPA: TM0106 family RecB-like putative nuclease [Candidatus Nanopelagicales bacterium]
MFVLDDVVVYSASDLTVASSCEFALLRNLDAKLGRAPRAKAADAMLARTAELGDQHEARVLVDLREQYGDFTVARAAGVVEIPDPRTWDRASLLAGRDETLQMLRAGADVVYQGAFFDGRFYGRADFLVKEEGRIAVYDSKLARHAKITALLQLAAYADQLTASGILVAPEAVLVLGDGTPSRHRVADLVPVYRERRTRMQQILDEHQASAGPVAWGDPRYLACGRCETCASEVAASDDLLLVAGLRISQRTVLSSAGITTMTELAEGETSVAGMSAATLESLRAQARLQVAQGRRPVGPDGRPDVGFAVFDSAPLAALPAPDAGDIFFDFEGDPLWAEHGSTDWGLEYLYGVVEAGPDQKYRSWWAHDRREEKQALVDFLDYVVARRLEHPGMHIYHYAAYEKTALRRLVVRHRVGEEVLDSLLAQGVLVDLYSTVRQSVRVSQPSYSIKKLEPLYMGTDLRSAELDNAADSIVEYAAACALRDDGEFAQAAHKLDVIEDYNHYDCVSTLRLLAWLRERGVENGVTSPAQPPAEMLEEPEPDELTESLFDLAGDGPPADRTPDQQAYAMLGASLGFHRREQKPYWWEHFDRLREPVDEWIANREVFVPSSVELAQDWHLPARKQLRRRELVLRGLLPEGTALGAGSAVTCIYGWPLPAGVEAPPGCIRGTAGGATVKAMTRDDDGADVVVIEELLRKGLEEYRELPMALGPVPGPPTTSIEAALREVAEEVVSAGTLLQQPALDVLRRLPPRVPGGLPEIVADDARTAITAALQRLDHSYLAVQGPPGTGKTYVGARVVRELVGQGWSVGVVAQSHQAVENFLDEVVAAGVDPDKIGKKVEDTDPRRWVGFGSNDYAQFLADRAGSGVVVGGTAWDFTNTKRVGRGQLDLLVIDEAGQFSLANTVAVSVSAQRLLLLGDPAQLPQVSQGSHPEPVDDSALGWLAEGHRALPPERGYFLEHTYRMHPALCVKVSRLSYDDRLHSQHSVAGRRRLDGIDPGVHVVPVKHLGRSVASPEEADEVVRQVRRVLGLPWSEDGSAPRPLDQAGVMVVAAYNAQVALIRSRLRTAGLEQVEVGTVDKLQGRQAPVVIVSMAASAGGDVPRGMGFLLSRNRVNVAVSRGQWAAIVIRSPWLTDYLPTTPDDLAELGAFIALTTEPADEALGTSPVARATGGATP